MACATGRRAGGSGAGSGRAEVRMVRARAAMAMGAFTNFSSLARGRRSNGGCPRRAGPFASAQPQWRRGFKAGPTVLPGAGAVRARLAAPRGTGPCCARSRAACRRGCGRSLRACPRPARCLGAFTNFSSLARGRRSNGGCPRRAGPFASAQPRWRRGFKAGPTVLERTRARRALLAAGCWQASCQRAADACEWGGRGAFAMVRALHGGRLHLRGADLRCPAAGSE